MTVAANLASVRDRIAHTGRDPNQITIVAVTKDSGPAECQEALEAGLTILGENRVQQALTKMAGVRGATWHLIGHLQTNKVKQVAGKFELIHTVDSRHLAEALARANSKQQVLVEVNVPREPQKSGVAPESAGPLIDHVAAMLDLRGLMAMGPADRDPTPAFAELRRLRDEAQERLGKSLPILSMGMSGDFEAAVRAGSTMLRLGQVLFGPRPR